MTDTYYPRRAYSILAETLSAQLKHLRAGMWRPDLGSLHGAALLARVEEMEDEGVLVPNHGALLHREHDSHFGRVFYEAGLAPHEVCEGLRRAGWQQPRAKD